MLRPMTRSPLLVRDIGVVIAVKLLILTLLYCAFFGAGRRPHLDAASVSDRLVQPFSPDGAAR